MPAATPKIPEQSLDAQARVCEKSHNLGTVDVAPTNFGQLAMLHLYILKYSRRTIFSEHGRDVSTWKKLASLPRVESSSTPRWKDRRHANKFWAARDAAPRFLKYSRQPRLSEHGLDTSMWKKLAAPPTCREIMQLPTPRSLLRSVVFSSVAPAAGPSNRQKQ